MRLTFVTAHYRSQAEYGGQRSRFQHEAALKAGLSAIVLRPSTDSLSGRKCKPSNVKDVISLPSNRFFYFGRRIFLLRILSQFIFTFFVALYLLRSGRNTIVVLNNNPMITYFIIGLFLKIARRKFVLDQRDVPFDKTSAGSPLIGNSLWKLHKRIASSRLGSLSVTEGIRERLLGNGDLPCDEVVELGMDEDTPSRCIGANFSPKHAALVYVGSLNSYFDLEALCRSLNACDFKGTLDYFGASEVASLEHFKFFRAMGSVSKNGLFDCIKKYDAGLFPLHNLKYSYYLMGNKVFDYINAGLPVCYFCEGEYQNLSVESALRGCHLGFRFHDVDWASTREFTINAPAAVASRYLRSTIDEKLSSFFGRLENGTNRKMPKVQ